MHVRACGHYVQCESLTKAPLVRLRYSDQPLRFAHANPTNFHRLQIRLFGQAGSILPSLRTGRILLEAFRKNIDSFDFRVLRPIGGHYA